MLSARWIAKRKPHWQRLTDLLERAAKHSVAALSHTELQELGLLYRQTAADLATVREDPQSQGLQQYLNPLLGRAHNLIYMGRKGSPGGIVRFYASTYPQIFRKTLPYTVLAFVVFFAGAVAGLLVTLADPAFSRFLLGPQMSDTIEHKRMWTDSIVAVKPLAASGIMTNNLTVSISAFALGITAGLGTLYLLAFNGLLFGVVLAACWQAGMLSKLLAFVAGHGVLELPAIFIAGGGGLLLARGLLFPGLLSRRDSLAQAGKQAVRLMLGTIPMLIVAGIIEAFISPTAIPSLLKFTFAAVLAGLFAVYLATAGQASAAVETED
jgi:uncharacterized membrane protein SpoIIM required for sporulation